MTSTQLKAMFKVPVYRKWQDVPAYLHTRTSAAAAGTLIDAEREPDAIKNAASISDKDKFYKLYDIRK